MTLEITTLANGMRVITETMPQLETATVGVWADVGARHEDAGINGIAHMLEHMAFKGTARRTARGIAEEIENVGGYLNAYTSRENTVYYARVLKDDVALGVDILSDILLNSTFEPDELERERQVILQEIGQANDTPDDLVFDMLQEATYPGQAMGRPILGTNETVGNMTRDQLAGYIDTHYRGERLVMVGVGKVDHQDLVRRAEDTFGKTSAGPRPAPEAAIYTGGERRETRVLEQAHVTLGFNGLAFDDPDYYAFQVYSTVLGGGMSSRLFQEVREVRGLAYSVYSFAQGYVDGGGLGVYAGTGEKEVADLIPVIAGEMTSLAAKAGADEVARGRAQLKAGLLMSLESSSSRMDQIGRQMLIFGRIIPIEEMVAAIDAVDEQAVERMAIRVLKDGPLSLAAIGPLSALEDYDRIAARFK
ncbi:M16 family metallopeptidase [Govanella unica]|uniref:Insulinase family protein n=1 Tax=Govanella unica TaxID=2975056 RepID=A0A9X3TWM9_9PROT|nr:pitrilysin family protein [Govania unica]MDA5193355.1 insulinase family protein [Govania unica]